MLARSLARAELDLQDARAVDLSREPALTAVLRSNGVGLPNYQVGWFRSKNGQRALCFLTRRDSVMYLPAKRSFVPLLNTSEPDQLLSALAS
jgi:PH (Pleckstrin Homology) domain-containing protein